MRKLLLTLGTVVAVAAPIAAVVACGNTNTDNEGNPTYSFKISTGTKASFTFHKKGYLISATLPSSVRGYSYSSDTFEKIYSKTDMDNWSKEDKVNFLLKNFDDEVTPEIERKIISAINSNSISFDVDLAEDFFTDNSYRNGVMHSEYIGKGSEALVDLGNGQFFNKLGRHNAEAIKQFILDNDPEMKSLDGFRYIDSSMTKEQLLANVDMIVKANEKITGGDQQSSNGQYQNSNSGKSVLGKYLFIYNSESEILDLDDYVSRSRGTSSSGYSSSNGISSFESRVNHAIKNIDDIDPDFELFI